MYCMYLEHEGFECVDATNGTDAIAIAMKRRPALILMDATMPGMDGWQAAGYIKADPTLRDIPLIMLTAHAFEEHRRRAVAIGADHFLAKPVLPDELARTVRRILRA